MRDVFYTILAVWIIWRIIQAVGVFNANRQGQSDSGDRANSERKEGKTTIEYIPPSNKKISDDEGEYVDYEEIK